MDGYKKAKILLLGAKGKMGQAIIEASDNDASVHFQYDVEDTKNLDLLEKDIQKSNCIIDFSHHSFTNSIIPIAEKNKTAVVIGCTGHTNEEIDLIKNSSKNIPIILAPNFSVGVNTLFWLAKVSQEILGRSYDVEITEMHHRFKKDSPSGTAKRLAEIIALERSLSYEKDVKFGRFGDNTERQKDEVGMHSLRGGDVVGDHTVCFAKEGERIELTHKASSRASFAKGAILSSKWILAQNPGLYDMQDVLGLK